MRVKKKKKKNKQRVKRGFTGLKILGMEIVGEDVLNENMEIKVNVCCANT